MAPPSDSEHDSGFSNFRALFSASPNAYVLLDRDLRIAEANEAYLEATGQEREEILGQRMFEAFPGDPEDPEDPNARRLKASFERVLSTGERDSLALIPYTIPRKTPEGTKHEKRYWSATHTPIFDEGGNVAYILQHTTDVTDLYEKGVYEEGLHEEESLSEEQRLPGEKETTGEEEAPKEGSGKEDSKRGATPQQVEEEVFSRAEAVQEAFWESEAERERLRRLFEQAPGFMVFQRGPDHVYELANDAYLDLIGRQDILGKPVREVLPELEEQGFFDLLDEVYETGESFVGREVEARVQKEFGEGLKTVYVDFIYQPVTGPGGEVTGIFTQGHDVTEKKRAKDRLRERQEELKELNETLEKRVEKRTRQVRELTTKVTMAEQRERERIARVLHDELQQKLFGIQLKMSSLQDGCQPEEEGSTKEQFLDQIGEMADQMEEAIQTTRHLSVGMSPPVLESEGLAAALEWLQSHIEETRGLDVRLEAEREFRVEEKIRILLFQSTRELLSNVAEHADVGQATVRLKEEGEDLVIEVADEGRGFEPAIIGEKAPEEGFGLTAARERIRLFGGDLLIDSAPGEGTKVNVRLPLRQTLG